MRVCVQCLQLHRLTLLMCVCVCEIFFSNSARSLRADALDEAQRRPHARSQLAIEDDVRARRRRREALGRGGSPEAAHNESTVVASGEAKVAKRQLAGVG